ncbi:MAG: hypothetical protein PVJ08_01355 [Dehalococcoidia bacterium]|jgi:hypothetical protein
MAKEKMLCPFSGKMCQECPLYRGRHYYLCFNKSYRGHLENADEVVKEKDPAEPVWMPDKMPSAVDPFQRPMADIWE